MFGALTAADPDEFIDEDIEATPTGFEVGVSEGIVADLTPAYDAAIKRLREQRGGLSAKERLGALLVGFGQPTRHGKWQESLGNASQFLFQQSLARRKEDEDRRTQLEKLMSAREIAKIRANATMKAAETRAAATAAGKPGKLAEDSDQRMRLGYAKTLFPDKTAEQIVAENLLYDSRVDRKMDRVYASRAGYPDDSVEDVAPSETKPTLAQFLVNARKVNPGVSDADLTAYYNREYGGN